MDSSILDSFVNKELSDTPSTTELILHLFWEKGIGWEEFKSMPIPYILTIVKAHIWMKNEEEKAYKRANRKK